MKTLLILILSFGFFGLSFGQEYHFVQFSGKDTTGFDSPTEFLSAKSLARRSRQGIELNERDYPVNQNYLDSITATGAELVYATKWLNGALVLAFEEQLSVILKKDFVRRNTPIIQLYGGTRVQEIAESCPAKEYASSKSQVEMLGADSLHGLGYAGNGISIAVFDDGFLNVDKISAFNFLMQNHLGGTYNIVNPESDVFSSGNRSHGTVVLSAMAAYLENEIVGTAYDADYYLFITENSAEESPVEELNWLVAAEKADSLGIDIINSSLGYYDFDDVNLALSYSDLDGDKAIITQAADFAASTGMLVVTSAGNEGAISWQKIIAPADADSVLAVGAVAPDGNKMSFSSEGPTADGRIKPNVMAQGGSVAVVNSNGNITKSSGTSFSTPIMAGFVACLWQAYPNLTNMELIDKLQKSGDLADQANNLYGYGIPDFGRFASLAGSPSVDNAYCNSELPTSLITESLNQITIFPNPILDNKIQISFPKELLGQELQISLVDLVGKTYSQENVLVQQAIESLEIRTRKLESGIYILTIITGTQEKTFRVLVE
ncbi:MAG: serine protease AprX [Arenicella sp.]|jgi:serine protease AprX